MIKAQLVVSTLLLVSLLVMACAPKTTPAPAPQAPAPAAVPPPAAVPAVPVKAAWEVEWEKTLAAARQEYKVVMVSSGGPVIRTALTEGFKKAYGIPIETILGQGAEVAAKIVAERRAGLYSYDVSMVGGSAAINLLKPTGTFDSLDAAFILPDVTNPELIKKVWWQEKLWWIDADHTNLASSLSVKLPIAINTNLVKEGEIKSYRDLLNPKWEGKLVLNDPTTAGAGADLAAFADAVLGWDYLVELARAKPIILRDPRQMLDWLAHGKVAIVAPPKDDTLTEFVGIGAPVKGLVPAEGTWLLGRSNLSIFNRPPHPNAAKVFINWLVSKEGQTIVSNAAAAQSCRLDVPTDYLPPEQVRQSGVKYRMKEDEKLLLNAPALQKKAKELFGPLMK